MKAELENKKYFRGYKRSVFITSMAMVPGDDRKVESWGAAWELFIEEEYSESLFEQLCGEVQQISRRTFLPISGDEE